MDVLPSSDHVSTWGEGPVWWEDHLWWVDIETHHLHRFNPEDQEVTSWDMGERIGFALPEDGGCWIWGGDNGVYRFDPVTGTSQHLTDPEPELPNNRFNDAGVSPDGRLFAGTIALDKADGAATLYRVDGVERCTAIVPNVTNSNGIGWSPDGTTCYYIDTPTRKIVAYAYERGEFGEARDVVDTDPVVDASPDGMCVDLQGHLWVAFCHGGCVIRFDSETGEVLERIDVGQMETTSCCFGGPEMRDLYITTGVGEGAKQSDGKVYVVKGLPIPGLHQMPVRNLG